MRLFWLLAFGFAWAITVPVALANHGIIDPLGIPMMAVRLTGFAPALAAVIASLASGSAGGFRSVVFRLRVNPLFYLAALALPALYLAASFVAADLLDLKPPKVAFTPNLAMFAGIWLVLAAGEEIGWRGFALPRLIERHGFWPAATYLGLAWTVWHYPLMLTSPYIMDVTQTACWISLFSLQIFLANFVICWLMARSGAVIVPTLFHMTFNVVATAYYAAAIDLAVTLAIAVTVLLIALFDREPAFPASSQAG